jgi:hypothetical protein
VAFGRWSWTASSLLSSSDGCPVCHDVLCLAARPFQDDGITVTVPLMLVSENESSQKAVGYPAIFFRVGGSTNLVEDKGQRERGSGAGSPLVRVSAQFANE